MIALFDNNRYIIILIFDASNFLFCLFVLLLWFWLLASSFSFLCSKCILFLLNLLLFHLLSRHGIFIWILIDLRRIASSNVLNMIINLLLLVCITILLKAFHIYWRELLRVLVWHVCNNCWILIIKFIYFI